MTLVIPCHPQETTTEVVTTSYFIRGVKMIGGTHGKILHVNLTNGETHIEQPNDDFYRLLVGGRAVVAYLLLRDLPPHTDALSPDNLLIFASSFSHP
jgi:hypothetical protein